LGFTVKCTRGEFTVTSDPGLIDHAVVTEFLAASYWSQGIPASTVARSIEGSLCFALRDGTRQIGFARVISDRATIAMLNDVFVLPEYRGRGLGKWLVECVMSHPELQGLKAWILVTRDAHELYEKFGFKVLARPERYMELRNPSVYQDAKESHPVIREP
jgi:GNAT superfamily N-acetyltransferase